MDLQLTRVDLLQTASTLPQTMKLLDSAKVAKLQKVCIADTNGTVQMFTFKKGEITAIFRTMPCGREISRVELGGKRGLKNKIFVAFNHNIAWLSKKGKTLHVFETQQTESIRSMFVEEAGIWTGGDYVYTEYDNGHEVNTFMASDKINDLTVDNVVGDQTMNGILACKDRYMRIIKGAEMWAGVSLEGTPVVVENYIARRGATAGRAKEAIYGTDNGVVGSLVFDTSSARTGWATEAESSTGGAQALCHKDFTGDGVAEVLVGRDNGVVEVLAFDVDAEPSPRFTTNLNESITSLQAGLVTHKDHDDLLLCTYSGKVISYTSQATAESTENDQTFENDVKAKKEKDKKRKEALKKTNQKIARAREDLEFLHQKIHNQRAIYQRLPSKAIGNASQFRINDKCVLNAEEAAYQLTIEIQAPLDVIVVGSDVNLDFREVDSNQAIYSRVVPNSVDTEHHAHLLATYRCQENVHRLEMKFGTVEGQSGKLTVYVMPKSEPKTCQTVSYPIKPLSLHKRVHELPELNSIPLNTLKLTGPFALNDIHAWVVLCLPEVPERIHDETGSMFFRQAFFGSVLAINYRRNEAEFKSDSLSTLAILKEAITADATARKITVDIQFDVKDESFTHFLSLMHPRLEHQLLLSKQVSLIEPLKEIRMQDEDLSFLSSDLHTILDNIPDIEKEFKLQPRTLEYIHDVVINLYVDKFKYKGRNVTNQVDKLKHLLQNYDQQKLLEFFNTRPN